MVLFGSSACMQGQMPAGALSDERGGARVLLAGLALWSVATAATPLAAKAPSSMQFGVAAASRFAMGLASACAMPAVASMAARWVPAARKAGILGMVYAFFNIGEHGWLTIYKHCCLQVHMHMPFMHIYLHAGCWQ